MFKHYCKRLLFWSLAVSTSTLALLSLNVAQPAILARENSNSGQLHSEARQIKAVDFQEFSKKLKEEISENKPFHVFKLGMGIDAYFRKGIHINELNNLATEHDFILVNNRASHKKYDVPHIFIMNKGDVIVPSKEKYDEQMREVKFAGNQPEAQRQRIHALFEIGLDSNKRQLLNAAGLGTAENTLAKVDDFTIYSHGLTVDNKYYENYAHFNEKSSINITKERFTTNDNLIHNLITASKAREQRDNRDKVKAFVMYVANHTTYDWEAANKAVSNRADVNYYLGSDLFAVTERKKAMCVGFSTTAARAFNMLGIPAYVVVGKNAQGVDHATARAYYNGKWHTIDGTGFINGRASRSTIYSENHFYSIGEDSYNIVDVNDESITFDKNYMKIDKVFEEWAPKQPTVDLLMINKDKSLVNSNYVAYVAPVTVDNSRKESLTQIYKKLKAEIESSSQKTPSQGALTSLLNTATNDIAKLEDTSQLTQENYNQIQNSMKSVLSFFWQLDRQVATNFENSDEYKKFLEDTKNAGS
ncbi:ribonucleases G and E [Streptococcus porcinus]|uniref:transglutaminase domain-containing protein n=1 Tax=Streptococcus porcinus TaxID=1340 RepID=UPI0010CACE87|nr:transglutaminase domain-containing protein [Streptococcus porcinus]VTS16606.1 ribonucleases G and E [Streptococcus porcinus]